MISLEEAVVRKLKASMHLLCTVESCTGGLISHLVTNVPGASEIYWGSLITYDNSAKEEIGIPSAFISTYGAVSSEVAQEMAERGLQKMKSCKTLESSFSLLKPKGLICLSTTGIAGPSGGSKEKPVGLCFIGLASSHHKTLVKRVQASLYLDRSNIKAYFAQKSLEFIRGNV